MKKIKVLLLVCVIIGVLTLGIIIDEKEKVRIKAICKEKGLVYYKPWKGNAVCINGYVP